MKPNLTSLTRMIQRREWKTVVSTIKRYPSEASVKELHLHEACKYDPPKSLVETFVRANRRFRTSLDENGELPIHTACFYGASAEVIEFLADWDIQSLSTRSRVGNRTPLEIAQSTVWENNGGNQGSVIQLLQKKTFPAFFDDLTGLPKKTAFDEWAHVSPNEKCYAFVFYIDIAGFKYLNDSGGQNIGDKAIKQYAASIKEECRKFEANWVSENAAVFLTMDIFRVGGDEFVVVVKLSADAEESSRKRVWKAICDTLLPNLGSLKESTYRTFVRVGCSAGFVSTPEHAEAIRKRAENLQNELKATLQTKRGEAPSLSEFQAAGMSKVNICNRLLEWDPVLFRPECGQVVATSITNASLQQDDPISIHAACQQVAPRSSNSTFIVQEPRPTRGGVDDADYKRKLNDMVLKSNIALLSHLDANISNQIENLEGNVTHCLDSSERHLDLIGQRIASSSLRPPSSSLPETIEIIGREDELSSLEKIFRSNGTMASLSGGGGMGKSHIAKTFARAWYEADRDARFVWWIASETEAGLRRDYLEMLSAMGETVEEAGKMSTSEIAANVWKKLSALSFDWLLVFDNVPESNNGPEGFKPQFFPTPLRGFNRGRVLFTSRSELFTGHTCIGHVTNVSVEPLPESAAVQMLLSEVPVGRYEDSNQETESAAAIQFARKVGYLPLALATVSGYVLSRQITIEEYLEEFKSREVTETVSEILQDSLAYARDQGMSDMLDIVAFVNPDSIPLELLGGDDVRGNARHLCELSILRRVSRGVYSVHRLHQEVLREGRSSATAVDALNGILESFDMRRSETWNVGRDMYLHIAAVEKYAKCHTNQERLSLARVLFEGGKFLRVVVNDFDGARAKLIKVLSMQRNVYGDDAKNADLASTLHSTASVLDYQGEYNEALSLYEEALAMKRHVYGADAKNVELASTLNNIAIVHYKRGEYDEATSLYEEALAMKRHMYGNGAKNTDLALTLNNIGEVHLSRGEYNEALALYEEALAMKRHVYGADAKNVDLASTLNNIAIVHYKRGEYDEATSLYVEALAMKRHVYGDDAKNADVASTLNNMAILNHTRAEYDEAFSMYDEVLAMQRHVYGKDAKNADLARTLNNIGLVHESREEYDDALAVYEDALAMYRHVFGDNVKNANYANTLRSIDGVRRKMGNGHDKK